MYYAKAYVDETKNYLSAESDNYIKVDLTNSLTDLTIELGMDQYTYDGNLEEPSVMVKDGDDILVLNTDYKDNLNAGKAKVIVVGLNKYKDSVEKDFIINKVTPKILDFSKNEATNKPQGKTDMSTNFDFKYDIDSECLNEVSYEEIKNKPYKYYVKMHIQQSENNNELFSDAKEYIVKPNKVFTLEQEYVLYIYMIYIFKGVLIIVNIYKFLFRRKKIILYRLY